MIVAKYTGCGNQPNGTSRFCFSDCAACTSPGPPVIDAALRRPRDREHVEHVPGLALADRLRREVGRGRGPGHAAAPRRRPHVVRRAEVLAEHVDVEVGERARPGEPVDVGRARGPASAIARSAASIADLARGAPRRLRVLRLADARRSRPRPARRRTRTRAPSRRYRTRLRNVSAARQRGHGVGHHARRPAGVASRTAHHRERAAPPAA